VPRESGARTPVRAYRAILFDADDTLFDFPRAEEEALAECWRPLAPQVGLEDFRACYLRHNRALWRELEAGRTTGPELEVERFTRTFAELGLGEGARTTSATYVDALAARPYLLPGAETAVRDLAARHPLALVTNGLASVQRRRFARSSIGHLFAAIVVSGELGVAKPDPRIFAPALAAVGASASEVLYVGDGVESDMAAAARAGMDFCWVNATGKPVPAPHAPCLVVRSAAELAARLLDVSAPRTR
jgi:2-haloacid dehalogenase